MESVSNAPELRWDKLIVGVAAPRVSCLGEKLLGRALSFSTGGSLSRPGESTQPLLHCS
ncbi:hypothetical protein F2Q69_00001156 [Brassica cretica]|uniref:Uncharacterized protein n=1 Tax=Brassica cretica TaxID=69181 RepID=A0A8S9NSF5_BRACR|nr:hypothetical protein F2Q69_00001156 [Brassica cretica]